ncbi:MAG: DUF167 domain-containing protein [Candidatus Omnitrophica bacterium]|nr:DUF167 domain-containing protein [Candidatus Omnitrophota bacterium]MCM8824904.1 DUF167 domain-containing protein [Candidatus Omnitrophota bacterium]
MRFIIKVKPYSREEKVVENQDRSLKVYVNEKPVEGKANSALIKLIAEYFDVPKSAVKIVSGHKSRNKIVEITK